MAPRSTAQLELKKLENELLLPNMTKATTTTTTKHDKGNRNNHDNHDQH
jgi:hypothetical protein